MVPRHYAMPADVSELHLVVSDLVANMHIVRWAKKEKKRQQVKTTSVSKPTSTSS